MPAVIEVNDLATLARYRPLWNDLLTSTPGGSFFQSYDWFVTWCHHAGGLRLRVLIVLRDGQPIGILPLVVRTQQRRCGSFRSLCYPLSDWGSFYGPIGRETEAILLAGLAHVRGTPRDWDVVDLCWVAGDQDDGATGRAMQRAGLPAHETPHAQTAQIDLAGGWETYWATRKSHWRTNVRRSEKRLACCGDVRHVRYRPRGSAWGDDDPRWDLYDTCVELAARSWQGDSRTGTTMSHAAIRQFLRDAHVAAVRQGALDLNLLLVGEQAAAFAYNYHYNGYVFGLRMGFDRQACGEGAGSVLTCRIIEDSFRCGDRTYDLGPGYLECKRQWWTRLASSYRYTHYPWHEPKAHAVRLARWIKQRCRGADRKSEIGSR